MTTGAEQLEHELVTRPERVVMIAGIGVSLATSGDHPNATWKGLLRHGLQQCQDLCGTALSTVDGFRGLLNDTSTSPHALASVGQFITDELVANHPGSFGRWLSDAFSGMKAIDPRIARALASLDVKLATTNYDNLIEDAIGRGPVTWQDRARVTIFLRENSQDVLHLHGHYRSPSSVILGMRSYGEICKDEFIQTALQSLLMSGTVLFAGCGSGLEDPNFGALLEWARSVLAYVQHSHFILVRACEIEEWRARLRGLPIVPIEYGAAYPEQAPFLEGLAERVKRRRNDQPVSLLTASQTDFDARWEDLERNRASLAPLEYLQRSRLLAWELWRAGGRRRAAFAFSGRLQFQGGSLLVQDYVDFAMDAAEWMLDEDLPSLASTHLAEIEQRIGKTDVSAEHLTRYRRLRVRCMDALCAYPESLRAIEEALPHVGNDERARLQAERSEIHFLQGDFPQAAAVSE